MFSLLYGLFEYLFRKVRLFRRITWHPPPALPPHAWPENAAPGPPSLLRPPRRRRARDDREIARSYGRTDAPTVLAGAPRREMEPTAWAGPPGLSASRIGVSGPRTALRTALVLCLHQPWPSACCGPEMLSPRQQRPFSLWQCTHRHAGSYASITGPLGFLWS
jgi:hypothetical protein